MSLTSQLANSFTDQPNKEPSAVRKAAKPKQPSQSSKRKPGILKKKCHPLGEWDALNWPLSPLSVIRLGRLFED